MKEANALYICDYDPNIPITTEAEPFIISTQTEVPTSLEIEEYKSLIQKNETQENIIKLLLIEKSNLLKEIVSKSEEIAELKNTDDKKALKEYKEFVYLVLPTLGKRFIFSNISGLNNPDDVEKRKTQM